MSATTSTRPTHTSYRNRLSQIFSWPIRATRSASLSASRLPTTPPPSTSSVAPLLSQSSTPPDDQPVATPPSSPPVPPTHAFPVSVEIDVNAPVSNVAIPPTTNELDAKEKARLIKKARKLSRVFGDDVLNLSQNMPQVPGVPSHPKHSRSTSQSSSMSHVSTITEAKKNIAVVPSPLPQIYETSQAPAVLDADAPELPHASKDPANSQVPSDDSVASANMPSTLVNGLSNAAAQATDSSAEQSTPTPSTPQSTSGRRRSAEHARSNTQRMLVKRRSRSLSARPVSRIMEETLNSLENEDPAFLEQDRVRAVKRARKMTKVFGPEFSLELATNKAASQSLHDLRSTSFPPREPTPEVPNLAAPTLTRERTRSTVSLPESLQEVELGLDKELPAYSDPDADEDPRSFQKLRRRAAKLQYFFGVEYQDLAPSLQVKEVNESPPVRIEMGRRVWAFPARPEVQEEDADMQNVREKLRGLRA